MFGSSDVLKHFALPPLVTVKSCSKDLSVIIDSKSMFELPGTNPDVEFFSSCLQCICVALEQSVKTRE